MLNLYPLIDGKLYQSGLMGEIVAILKVKPTIIIDCTSDVSILNEEADLFIKIPFCDEPLPIDKLTLITRLEQVAFLAAGAIRNKEKVLTHCNAGENRSSLVDGLILIQLRKMGLIEFSSVVSFIREKRPGALQNKSFVEYLESQTALHE